MSSMPNNISPAQAYEWLQSGKAVLIDVREPDEFKAEHIAYAQSWPLAHVGSLYDKTHMVSGQKIIFQCLKGGRGQQACAIISQCQKSADCDVYNIEGGIQAWKEAGLSVIGAGSASGVTIFRQVQMIVGILVLISSCVGLSGVHGAFVLTAILGAALAFAGASGWCGLAIMLAKAPWNRKTR